MVGRFKKSYDVDVSLKTCLKTWLSIDEILKAYSNISSLVRKD